eukprot:6293307-Pyramimonas_sp.AAC.2
MRWRCATWVVGFGAQVHGCGAQGRGYRDEGAVYTGGRVRAGPTGNPRPPRRLDVTGMLWHVAVVEATRGAPG